MKLLCSTILSLLVAGSFIFGVDLPTIEPGQGKAEVRREIGSPTGYAEGPNRVTWFYRNGQVVFERGLVVSASFVPEEAVERAEREAIQRRKEQAAARQARIAEGSSIFDQEIRSKEFREKPPQAQLSYLRSFSRAYPEINVSLERTRVLQELRQIREDQLARQRILAEREQRIQQDLAKEAFIADRPAPRSRSAHHGPVIIHPSPGPSKIQQPIIFIRPGHISGAPWSGHVYSRHHWTSPIHLRGWTR